MNIFEFAKSQEAQAEATYRNLAQSARNRGLKTIFTMLADNEKRHFQTIVKMEKAEDADLENCTFLDDSKRIIATLSLKMEAFKLDAPQIDIYLEAQKKEKETEAFYRQKARETQDEHHRKLLLSLAEEEFDHFTILDEIIILIGHPEMNLENAEFNKR